MRLLVLTDRYPPYYEGAYELNCHQVTDALMARGHEATVLTSTFGTSSQRVDGHIHRVLYLCRSGARGKLLRRWSEFRQFFKSHENYKQTRRLSEHLRPDVAFVWHMQGTSIVPVFAIQDLGIPTVFRIGSHWLIQDKLIYSRKCSALKRWYRSGLLGFRRFEELNIQSAIVVSDTLRRSYAEAGFDVGNMIVVPTGIPQEWICDRLRATHSTGKTLRLLYAGRIEVTAV